MKSKLVTIIIFLNDGWRMDHIESTLLIVAWQEISIIFFNWWQGTIVQFYIRNPPFFSCFERRIYNIII